MSLYPNYKPHGVKPGWDRTSMTKDSSGDVLRRHHIDAAWGDPIDAVAWFDGIHLRVLVADYANGRRVTLRQRRSGSSLEVVTPQKDPS